MNNLSFRPLKLEIKIYITIEIIINNQFWYLKIKKIGRKDKKDIKKIKYNKVI